MRSTWVLGALLTAVACSSGAGDGGHGQDVGPDAGVSSDAGADASATADAASEPCQPACGTAERCCTDQHGHFPKCVTGTSCP